MSDQLERAIERAEDDLVHDYEQGLYTQAEYNKRMSDLRRDYRDALEEAAEAAYDDVMYRRGGYQ